MLRTTLTRLNRRQAPCSGAWNVGRFQSRWMSSILAKKKEDKAAEIVNLPEVIQMEKFRAALGDGSCKVFYFQRLTTTPDPSLCSVRGSFQEPTVSVWKNRECLKKNASRQ